MWHILKPILFQLSAERAHYLTMNLFQLVHRWPGFSQAFPPLGTKHQDLQEINLMGLSFPNPIGLAAGFDKDARFFHLMPRLGFGFVEIGTITPKPQAGNPAPRLFRLPKDEALINRMGFNNLGVEAAVARLSSVPKPNHLIIGGNIGKNKWTPNEDAYKDYEICFTALHPWVDYFVVNVSSPNTPDLRSLQDKEPLRALLHHLQDVNQGQNHPKPILLKIAPDLTTGQVEDIAEIVISENIPGLVISNTTIDRSGLRTSKREIEQIGAGGLSGAPIQSRSTQLIAHMRKLLPESIVIIGVGGINSITAAKGKMDAGANLIQIYSGLIYEGPGLVRQILSGLLKD